MPTAVPAATETAPAAAEQPAADRPTLLLIDGYGLIFRAFHAHDRSVTSLATSGGELTGAVFGFAMMLLDVLRREQPDYAIVALEGGRTFRHDDFEDYKAHRGEMPDDLRRQMGRVLELIDALGIPIERRDGFEADDIIGSLAARCSREGRYRVLIVTGDSDLLQLVDDNVHVVLPGALRFSELRYFDCEAVKARYGFGPELLPDYKALVGDTSDNIPGVPGIGDKTAKALIERFGNLERIIAHLDEVTPPRAKAALEAHIDQARFSKKLATIVRDLDIPFDPARATVGNYDRDRVVNLFRELEFRSLLDRLPPPKTAPRPVAAPRPAAVRTTVRDAAGLARVAERMRATGAYAVDVETTSTDPILADLVGIAIAVSPAESFYIPIRQPNDGEMVDPAAVRQTLGPVLADPALRTLTHHGKYDREVLGRHGLELAPIDGDTMIAAYLLGENKLRLKDLAFTKLGIEMTEIEALIGRGRTQLTMDLVASEQVAAYACGDVEATFALAELLEPAIREQGLAALYREIELPLIPVLADMELAGIAIDVDYLHELSIEITQRFKQLEQEIYRLAGHELNIGSTKQLGQLLFEELKLPTGRRTKTGYSVDSDVLSALRDQHPIIDLILEHRSLAKLKSTYVDALPQQVNPRTGRVHTSFNQTVAETGRLSSTNPNLQNIPIRTESGRRVRHAFIADHRPEHRLCPDAVLLSADYSQIELRILADMSGEPFLVDAYRRGEDIHRATAALVYGVAPEEVTPAMRRVAKTVNFGVAYGMQSYGLARDTGMSRAEAQRFIDEYWARLPRVRALFDETLRFGREHGYVQAPSGRRRAMPDLTSSNGLRRLTAERQAMNMPVQATAADIMKRAMIRVFAALHESKLPARILLQVHDELVLEVDRPALTETARLLREQMISAATLSVPLEVELAAGQRWDELEPLAEPAPGCT